MHPEPVQQMFQLISGGLVAQSVSVAAELGLADLLAHGPKPTAHLASAAGATLSASPSSATSARSSPTADVS